MGTPTHDHRSPRTQIALMRETAARVSAVDAESLTDSALADLMRRIAEAPGSLRDPIEPIKESATSDDVREFLRRAAAALTARADRFERQL